MLTQQNAKQSPRPIEQAKPDLPPRPVRFRLEELEARAAPSIPLRPGTQPRLVSQITF
jgi:hypothetical protein